MSSLQYYNDAGAGEERNRLYHYSQAVVVGDTVKLAGQGGWTPENALDANDGDGQVELAFRNVERVLETVGLGWDDVYSVRTYHTSLPLSMAKTVETLAKYTPNHKPILTGIGVSHLADPRMLIEIEVEAYAGKK
ncbi:putative endoribonuclease l-psp protein [Neofusicoccum parvum]|uniref:Endoribonuclease l-psp protein n=2 Tax=Neofusicoccum parvum TaxID=310453 RepID=A0ACB5S6B5_9PEZI|nr:putative endoribonuclease l-psp protein [Neofusicoccum parvum UCRNP2]GME28338.1 putative endoribonuclease l-psp protein [Neofusicoccum parvum]GME63075.1 putative endoribonuclease l-psp protein [Neofusicoccum parvum]